MDPTREVNNEYLDQINF